MRRGLMAAFAGAAMALSFAPGVRAQVPPPTGSISVTAPKPNDTFNGPYTTSGSAHADNGATLLWVKAALAWATQGVPPPPMPAPRSICGVAPSAEPNPNPQTCAGGGSDVTFTNAPMPLPTFNGTYKLVATGHIDAGPFGQADVTDNHVDFAVVVAPATPTNFKASTSTKNRLVTLGWDRNGEADLYGYGVYRLDPGQTKPPSKATFVVTQTKPEDGNRVSVEDQFVPAPGGQYTYLIQAIRPGATADIKTSYVISPTSSVKATVAPGTPSNTEPPGGPAPGGGGTPVIKGTGSNAPRQSSAGAPNITSKSPSTSEAVTPDPGFVSNLPYGATTIPGEEDNGDNANVAINQEPSGKSKSNQRGLLIPAATGAILFVAAFQLRWLKKRLEEPVSTPLS